MRKLCRRVLSICAAVLLFSTMTLTVFAEPVADEYEPIAGGTTSFEKYLTLEEDANVPNTEFTFTVAPGEAVGATETSPEVYAGVGTVTATSAVFAVDDSTLDAAEYGDTVAIGEGQKYAKKTITLDFSGASYNRPGIYRYVVTETAMTEAQEAGGISISDGAERIMDVYVEDDDVNGGLKIAAYVLHDSAEEAGSRLPNYEVVAADTALVNNAWYYVIAVDTEGNAVTYVPVQYVGAEKAQIEEALAAGTLYTASSEGKDAGFSNDMVTSSLYLEKQVLGNQGNRNEYFEFTVTLTGALPNTRYAVDMTNADAGQVEYITNGVNKEVRSNLAPENENGLSAFEVSDDSMIEPVMASVSPYYIDTDAEGAATLVVYLKDNQSIRILGIAPGVAYSIEETVKAEEGYDTYYVQDTDASDDVEAEEVTGIKAEAEKIDVTDDTVLFKNYRQGTIPTGVMNAIIPTVVLLVCVGAVFAFIMISKKRRSTEN